MSPSTRFTGPPTAHWPQVSAGDQPTCQNHELDLLADRLIAEMTAAWGAGSRPNAEKYFALHPEICLQPPVALRVIMAELALRQHHGQTVNQHELACRFPEWEDQLRALLASERCHAAGGLPQFPELGETLGGFQLVAELGRGAKGVVYLARQTTLADRPVVLKMTAWEGMEHLSLARLQHTHIVPLFDVFEFPVHRLRALCMPYLGGLALDALLRRLQDRPLSQRRGKDLMDEVDAAQASVPVQLPARGGARELLSRATYVEAICWLGVCLADAVQHAHERGLVHLDIKPANVLLAADGTPLLLDFHLAREPVQPNGPPPPWFGGTPDYMSPEQRQVLAAVSARRPIPVPVDGRSDIYSLGVLLQEALGPGGKLPNSQRQPPLHMRHPEVSIGLSDLLARCTAAKPEDRYPSAGALAEDLRRHLTAMPLKGVANRSWPERWHKWRQRRPGALRRYGLASAAILALLIGIGGIVSLGARQWTEAQLSLSRAREAYRGHDYPHAKEATEEGLANLRFLPVQLSPGLATLQQHLLAERELCQRALLAGEIHQLAEALHRISRLDAVAQEERLRLEGACRRVWELRRLLDASALLTDHGPRRQLLLDFLEIGLTASELRVLNAAQEERAAAHREALNMLADLEQLQGRSPVFEARREQHYRALQLPRQAQAAARQAHALPVCSGWEAYHCGRLALSRGELETAASAFGKAVELSPGDFWSHFQRGLVCAKLGRQLDALHEFDTSLALRPDTAECWYNRALAHEAAAQDQRALQDYTEAILRKDAYADALLNRGLLFLKLQREAEAIEQLNQASAAGAEPAIIHLALAQAYQRLGNRAEALANAKRALHLKPDEPAAKALLQQLLVEK